MEARVNGGPSFYLQRCSTMSSHRGSPDVPLPTEDEEEDKTDDGVGVENHERVSPSEESPEVARRLL